MCTDENQTRIPLNNTIPNGSTGTGDLLNNNPGTSGSSGSGFDPQKQFHNLKKYHFKGKYPKPR